MNKLQIKTFFILLLISLGLMVLDAKNLLNPVKNVAETVTVPVQFGVYRVKMGFGETFSFLTFWKSGEARIKDLELRNLELQGFKNQTEVLTRENEDLKKQLGVSGKRLDTKLVEATVIGRGQYLELASNAPINSLVVYGDNYIGTVIKADGKMAFVQLPTDSKAKIPVRVGRANGLSIGQFNTGILLDQVASTEEVKLDDFVVTAADNLIIGKVKKITSSATDLFVTAQIAPLINYDQLTTVFWRQ